MFCARISNLIYKKSGRHYPIRTARPTKAPKRKTRNASRGIGETFNLILLRLIEKLVVLRYAERSQTLSYISGRKVNDFFKMRNQNPTEIIPWKELRNKYK
jgi:hypothetical protein